ncbi:MAG TPA: hypothetical protein VI233_00460 [Puia sp.]
MQVFRFLSRVAFICNVCYLLASFIQWLPHPPEGEIITNIIVFGFGGSLLINLIFGLSVVILFAIGKLRAANIPVWLLVVNLLFFILQVILIVINQK